MNHRLSVVAQPDPTAPIAGAPKFPKMSIQLKKTLAAFARRITTTIGPTRPIDCRPCRNTTKQ